MDIAAREFRIVGAMAVSPDLLPIPAACVGLASRRGQLFLRAIATLVIGMGAACLAAAVLSVCRGLLGLLPPGFVVGEAALAGLTTINSVR